MDWRINVNIIPANFSQQFLDTMIDTLKRIWKSFKNKFNLMKTVDILMGGSLMSVRHVEERIKIENFS